MLLLLVLVAVMVVESTAAGEDVAAFFAIGGALLDRDAKGSGTIAGGRVHDVGAGGDGRDDGALTAVGVGGGGGGVWDETGKSLVVCFCRL